MIATARPQARPPIVTGAFLLRLTTVVASSIGFFLPFAVVPAYAERSAGPTVAGAANAALLVTTVLVELAAPALVARLGYRWSLGLGLFTLGAPTLLLLTSSGSATILTVSVLRGVGFAVTVVAGGALTAELVPAERRGEGLALAGLVSGVSGVSGVSALLALPAGSWLMGAVGYDAVFAATAVLSVLPILAVPFLPGRPAATDRAAGVTAGLRSPDLMWPAVVFAVLGSGFVKTAWTWVLSPTTGWLYLNLVAHQTEMWI
ncbi:MFS transporter [Nonomuraea sp. NPDC050643]|uniref:MFS transporter n=1 Tax=Nonomuraea sp. NPDC050643 TaxID=3155660 RepID=UPI0033D2D749